MGRKTHSICSNHIIYQFYCHLLLPCLRANFLLVHPSHLFKSFPPVIMHHKFPISFFTGSCLENQKYCSGLRRELSVKESDWQCRRHRFDPWFRKIPYVAERLSPRTPTIDPVLQSLGAATIEPMCLDYWSLSTLESVPWHKRSHCNEKPQHHN